MKVVVAVGLAFLAWQPGCVANRYLNSAPRLQTHIPVHRSSTLASHIKAGLLIPARDILVAEPFWRRLSDTEAWNLVDGDVPEGSFYEPRGPEEWTPQRLAEGHRPDLAPRQPFKIDRVKTEGVTPGFFGTDAEGRRYVVKLDDPKHFGLGSSSSVITSRIYHVFGYHVPATFALALEGTGDPRFDGHRASASVLIPDAIGQFRYDWFRHRRELRALRMAAAWVNDTDRGPHNNLVVMENGAARCYLIDFNSALGSWQGRPKEAWRGWVYAIGSLDPLVRILTMGLVHPGYDPNQRVISPAVGRFDAHYDPMTWAPQVANTAFDQMTRADAEWIIKRIAQLERPHLEAIVSAAGLTRAEDREYLVETLLARQAKILALSPPSRSSHASGGP